MGGERRREPERTGGGGTVKVDKGMVLLQNVVNRVPWFCATVLLPKKISRFGAVILQPAPPPRAQGERRTSPGESQGRFKRGRSGASRRRGGWPDRQLRGKTPPRDQDPLATPQAVDRPATAGRLGGAGTGAGVPEHVRILLQRAGLDHGGDYERHGRSSGERPRRRPYHSNPTLRRETRWTDAPPSGSPAPELEDSRSGHGDWRLPRQSLTKKRHRILRRSQPDPPLSLADGAGRGVSRGHGFVATGAPFSSRTGIAGPASAAGGRGSRSVVHSGHGAASVSVVAAFGIACFVTVPDGQRTWISAGGFVSGYPKNPAAVDWLQ